MFKRGEFFKKSLQIQIHICNALLDDIFATSCYKIIFNVFQINMPCLFVLLTYLYAYLSLKTLVYSRD